jgi:choline dehydrogenase-like flavoprotein
MAQRLKPVDVVTIGVGLNGSLAALELAKAGLKVVGLERGAPRYTVPDFQSPAIHDERFAAEGRNESKLGRRSAQRDGGRTVA